MSFGATVPPNFPLYNEDEARIIQTDWMQPFSSKLAVDIFKKNIKLKRM